MAWKLDVIQMFGKTDGSEKEKWGKSGASVWPPKFGRVCNQETIGFKWFKLQKLEINHLLWRLGVQWIYVQSSIGKTVKSCTMGGKMVWSFERMLRGTHCCFPVERIRNKNITLSEPWSPLVPSRLSLTQNISKWYTKIPNIPNYKNPNAK